METTGSKPPRRPRRAFTPEFKAEIVELCQRGDRSVGQIARDFDLTETAVRDWVKQGNSVRASSRSPHSDHDQLWPVTAEAGVDHGNRA